MTEVTSVVKQRPKQPLTQAQTAFLKEHYNTMQAFAAPRFTDPQHCAGVVHESFEILFSQDPELKKPVEAMIQLYQILDDQCRGTSSAKTSVKQKGRLLKPLRKSA
ncbi:hypothetical protein DCC81_03540 [Chitinophaga parva]|uniref:Uncharacterized protein n=1 Tax=Chitinophaga parva TaxID=2169414 RepID=A0A2T7BLK4_9BACT|nr:hypothetical protein [Chitinophaga parva]PUZ28567.1 hypothetical protein DCC81_03540 [Chitinophaga parva]